MPLLWNDHLADQFWQMDSISSVTHVCPLKMGSCYLILTIFFNYGTITVMYNLTNIPEWEERAQQNL